MKVLVIEDDAEIIEFISIAFDIGWTVSELITTHQGSVGVKLAQTSSPDIVILDLGLPDVNGFDVLKQIRTFSQVPVIIETVRGSEADVVKGLNGGADEYIVKPFEQIELLARVRAVLRRQKSPSLPGGICAGPLSLDMMSGKLSCGAKSVHLTTTESLLAQLLMVKAGRVVTFAQLAETVWGDDSPRAADTLRVHIRHIRAKIKSVSGTTGLIDSRPGIGYVFEIQG